MIRGEVQERVQLYAIQEALPWLHKYIVAFFSVNCLQDQSMEDWYDHHGLTPGTTIRAILNNNLLEVWVIPCDHSVPTISFGFGLVKQKLKAEFVGTAGKEIARLRKEGVTVTEEVVEKKFTFICDTSILVLEQQPEIFLYPVVIIECTFLYPDEIQNSLDTKHIHWQQLLPFVKANPRVLFVLIHFSLRYRDAEIKAFFDEQCTKHDITNIKPWLTDPQPAETLAS